MSRPIFSQSIHDDFMRAIDELPDTQVTFSSVADRAKHARGLISRKACPYPDVRNRIVGIRDRLRSTRRRKPSPRRKKLPAEMAADQLRVENRSLKAETERLRSALAATMAAAASLADTSLASQVADRDQRRAARAARAKAESPT